MLTEVEQEWPPYWDLCARCNRDVEHVNGEPTAHNNADGAPCVAPRAVSLDGAPTVWWDGETLYVIFPGNPEWVRLIGANGSRGAFGKVDTADCVEFVAQVKS